MKKLKNIDFLIILFNLLPWFLIIFYLYNLQIVKANDFHKNIEKIESSQFQKIYPKRGQIYVHDKNNNLYPVAISLRSYDLYFNPKSSKDINKELGMLEKIFPELGYNSVSKNTPTSSDSASISLIKENNKAILLKKDISEELYRIVKNLKLDSIFFEEHYSRFYPEKNFLSSIVGFAVKNNEDFLEGKYGIEKYYDEKLKGESGYQLSINKMQAPMSGKDVVLNIDYFVQKEAEKNLKESIQNFNAQGGLIVISELDGKIIALAEEPSYDLNKFNEVTDYKIFLTKFTQNYEPGSVMKTITYLSAIENNIFDENKTYYDEGYFIIDGWRVSNFDKQGRGEITLGEAFEQSLNTGSVYLEKLIGHNNFLNTLKKFKFDQPPEIDLPNLTAGNLNRLSSPFVRNVNFATASYGHGISLSPVHLLSAINIIASNGKKTNLSLSTESKTMNLGNILKPQSAYKIRDLMERVVLNGSGKSAKTAGFRLGGKTGSAFVPLENQKGYSEDVINTFVMILPLTNPKFVILVRVDKPSGLAGVTTVPAAKKMIEFLINYYNLQPDKTEELAHY